MVPKTRTADLKDQSLYRGNWDPLVFCYPKNPCPVWKLSGSTTGGSQLAKLRSNQMNIPMNAVKVLSRVQGFFRLAEPGFEAQTRVSLFKLNICHSHSSTANPIFYRPSAIRKRPRKELSVAEALVKDALRIFHEPLRLTAGPLDERVHLPKNAHQAVRGL